MNKRNRKIFLDCGANRGQSILQFVKNYPYSKRYEIYSFECTKNKDILNSWHSSADRVKQQVKSISLLEKAVWIEDNDDLIFYDSGNESSSIIKEKNCTGKTKVSSIDISKFIASNFSKDYEIILKIDIEGAEYSVLDKMLSDGTIDYINRIYGELHGPKCGVSYSKDLEMIDRLDKSGHLLYYWDATNDTGISEKYYTQESLFKFHKKYNFLAGK
jgi:hypothetical protein